MASDDYIFPFVNGELIVGGDDAPLTETAFADSLRNGWLAVGEWQGRRCWTMPGERVAGGQAVSLRSRLGLWADDLFQLAGRAAQLHYFAETHQFCGRCGTAMDWAEVELARICPRCDHICYPRISPCVIVAVWRPGEILLAQHHRHKSAISTVLAGFIEAGETAEQCLHREVFEEVGVKVAEPVYQGSQPWPFPHSLMLAYTARWLSGEIQIDPGELSHAAWYRLDQLPVIAPSGTIARRLIDQVLATEGLQP